MNIKKVSEITGVSADTIRYYERIGLIAPVRRNQNGVREFDEEDIRWITFSRQMRNAGLSIESLVEYLSLFRQGDETVDARIALIRTQKEELEAKAAELSEAIHRLQFKLDNYGHVQQAESRLRDFDVNRV
ncbi:HTH-type transcriptional regulator AdhR [Listeria fleischmannii 1991]|uniref:HTH-type transcriptional regulator AdhR n=2 Tax=Listeria fleischmannii TaxID=1069827 RepID=A0A2X3H4P7_9LIST|nr:MerR family transcriptional regulator [Listeria fleischmannii]EMG28645.1 putative transcription regulator, MerR family protein [Listeria fleischmannii subsp. fleischmannii LU2006-1]KMT59663.1 HTH-type transcriptional regulator AdhR [Listeria fleischmannii 1991]SQC67437.1 HTH-type transcriptional regulator AdhR [Listeria fleischmannii subsp. fleischmannii]